MLVLRRALSVAVTLTPLLRVAPAGAASPVQLVYRAAPQCPSQDQFELAVNERGARFDAVPAALEGATLDVALRAEPGGFVGTLELRGTEGGSERREVHAARCADAMHGLGVIAALLLHEPQGSARAEPEPAPDAAETPGPPLPAPLPPTAAAATTRLHNIGQFGDERLDVPAGALSFEAALAQTLTAGVEVGSIPGVVMPRYDLTLSRANVVTVPGGDHYLMGGWVPRARWTMLGTSTYRSGELSVDLLGLKAALGGCTSLVYDLDGLVLLFCGEVGAGVMRMETKDTAGSKLQTRTVGLGSAGVGLDVQYNLTSLFHLDARLGGDLTFGEIRAERPDGSEIFAASPWSAHAQFGVGLHFW